MDTLELEVIRLCPQVIYGSDHTWQRLRGPLGFLPQVIEDVPVMSWVPAQKVHGALMLIFQEGPNCKTFLDHLRQQRAGFHLEGCLTGQQSRATNVKHHSSLMPLV